MKKIATIVVSVLLLVFSSVSFAGASGSLTGKGTTVSSVKSFNKAVAYIGGTVEVGSQTEFSSVGNFGKQYQAKMYAEENKGGVTVRITVDLTDNPNIFGIITDSQKKNMMDIAIKIGEAMKKDGYEW